MAERFGSGIAIGKMSVKDSGLLAEGFEKQYNWKCIFSWLLARR